MIFMLNIFLLSLVSGYINSIRGRKAEVVGNEYGLLYSKYVFVLAIAILAFVGGGFKSFLLAFAVFGLAFATGTGGMHQAFNGRPQKKMEFWPIDKVVYFITKIKGWEEGVLPAKYRKYGVWYITILSLIQYITIFLVKGFTIGGPFILLSGLIVGALRYLPEKISKFVWVAGEIVLGVLWFVSITL